MKKITRPLIFVVFALGCTTLYSQNSNIDIAALLERAENIEPNGGTPLHYFTSQELEILRSYLQENSVTAINKQRAGGGIDVYCSYNSSSLYGFFNTGDINSFTAIGSNLPTTDFESSGDIDPTDHTTAYVLTLVAGEFNRLDVDSGVYTSLGTLTPPGGEQWNGLEYDPTTGVLYGISSDFIGTSTLSTVDTGAMTITPIGITGMPGAIAIAVTDTGDMYGHDVVDDNFYSIDKTTGIATLIGPIGFDANFGQDMEWDPFSSTMIMTAFNNATVGGEFRTVDLTTGATTFIDVFFGDSGAQLAWSSIKSPPLSVNDFSDNTITILPNPATNELSIQSFVPVHHVEVFNMLGQRVLVHEGGNTVNIDVSKLTKGTYIVLVNVEGSSIVKKLVKR